MRREIIAPVLLVSAPALAHSPGAMVFGVGAIALFAVVGGFFAKRALVRILHWSAHSWKVHAGVMSAELVALLLFFGFFVVVGARMLSIPAYWVVAAWINRSLLDDSAAFSASLVFRCSILALVAPIAAAIGWFVVLQPRYIGLGG